MLPRKADARQAVATWRCEQPKLAVVHGNAVSFPLRRTEVDFPSCHLVFARMCSIHIKEHGERSLAVRSQERAPNDVDGMSPCNVAENVIGSRRTPVVTSSEAECRDAVCIGVLRNITVMRERQLNGAHFSLAP